MQANDGLYNVSLLPDTYYRYFEVGVGYFITNAGDKTYASTYDFEKYNKFIAGTPDPTSKAALTLQGNFLVFLESCIFSNMLGNILIV